MNRNLSRIFAVYVLLSLLFSLWMLRRTGVQGAILDTISSVPPGITRADAERRLGPESRRGRRLDSGYNEGHGLDVEVPKGGYVVLYDSFMVTRLGFPAYNQDFAVVYSRRNRVVTLVMLAAPPH